MNILVLNCGSSSLNYKVFQTQSTTDLAVGCSGKAHRVGVTGSEPSFIEHRQNGASQKQITPIPNHRQAAILVLEYLRDAAVPVDVIGHRFVHGGGVFQASARLTPDAYRQLVDLSPLAPIHNPNSLSVIDVCRERLPGLPQYLTFDTAFHSGLPESSYTYALPREIVQKHDLRKYGFHGLSYQFVTRAAARCLDRPLESLRLVACHLGTGGSSAAAIMNGRSIDTSMGYSPLAGLMMSTRTGDLDPLLPVRLLREGEYDAAGLNALFNKKSGTLGVAGFSSDLRDVLKAVDEQDDPRARLAFDLYTHRLKKTIGAYITLLGGVDALIFTDDIGVQNARVREAACQGLEWCGLVLDPAANRQAAPDRIEMVSAANSAGKILSIPTDEEWVIGQEGARLFQEASDASL